jgi:hypothetical protein
MAGLSITGQMKVSTLQDGFLKEFGLTLRVYDGRAFADPTQTLAQVRKKKGSGKDLSVAKNMKVGNLEDKIEEEFGLKVQVAGSDDSYLCDNNLTLNAAQQEDEKKLARKDRKTERQEAAGDDSAEKSVTTERLLISEVLQLITSSIGHDEINLSSIWGVASVSEEIWESVDSSVSGLDQSKLDEIDAKIIKLTADLEVGDFWQLVVLTSKMNDVRHSLNSLTFENEFELRATTLSAASDNILKFIRENDVNDIVDDKLASFLVNYFNDCLIVLLEAAMDEGDEESLADILSFSFDLRSSDEISGCSTDLAEFARNTMDFNYIDQIVETAIFLVCQNYHLEEDDIRDDDGGISASLVVTELSVLL